jgi:hypothetical protein
MLMRAVAIIGRHLGKLPEDMRAYGPLWLADAARLAAQARREPPGHL